MAILNYYILFFNTNHRLKLCKKKEEALRKVDLFEKQNEIYDKFDRNAVKDNSFKKIHYYARTLEFTEYSGEQRRQGVQELRPLGNGQCDDRRVHVVQRHCDAALRCRLLKSSAEQTVDNHLFYSTTCIIKYPYLISKDYNICYYKSRCFTMII